VQLPYAVQRFGYRNAPPYGVLQRQLASNEYSPVAEYTIADMACWAWIITYKAPRVDLERYPHESAGTRLCKPANARRGYVRERNSTGMKLVWIDGMEGVLLPGVK